MTCFKKDEILKRKNELLVDKNDGLKVYLKLKQVK